MSKNLFNPDLFEITPEMEKQYDEFFDRVVRPRLLKCQKPKSLTEKIFWITVNPKVGIDVKSFSDSLAKACNKKWIKSYYYNIEQRGETPDTAGEGLHSHFLAIPHSYKRISQVIDEFYNTFKASVGNKKHVYVKMYPISMLQDKIDYLQGKKWDNDKQTKVAMDNYFREKNNIPLIYTNNGKKTDN